MKKTAIISSPANPLVKDVRRAIKQGELTSDGLMVAETYHLLEEALRSRLEIPVVLAAAGAQRGVEARLDGRPYTRLVVLPDSVFEKLPSTETAQGVIALIQPPKWQLADLLGAAPLVVVLDGIQDPGNAGSIVRAAEAFGATGVMFLKRSVNPFNPKTIRASAGSIFRVPFQLGLDAESARDTFHKREVHLYAANPRGNRSPGQVDFRVATSIVIGSEAQGVRKSLAQSCEQVSITTKIVESLNAAQAAAVILYEAARQRGQI